MTQIVPTGAEAAPAAGAGAPPGAAAAAAAHAPPPRAPRPRLYFVDWLRLALTALVVLHHTVCLYFTPPLSSVGQTGIGVVFAVKYPPAPTPPAATWFLWANQSYFMGLFFTLSGLFTTGSYNRKGALMFITDRALRLVLPLLVWDFVLQPLIFSMTFLGQGAFLREAYITPNPLPTTFAGVWRSYFQHYTGIGHSQMWFVLCLFLFDLAYLTFRLSVDGCARIAPNVCGKWPALVSTKASPAAAAQHLPTTQADAGKAAAAAAQQAGGPYYSTRRTVAVLAAVWVWVAGWMCVSLHFNGDQMFTSYIMQLPVKYAPQYVSAYVLGIVLDLRGALPRLPRRLAYGCLAVNAAVVGGLMPAVLFAPLSIPAGAPQLAVVYVFMFIEQLHAVCFCYALLSLGRTCFNAKPGRFGALLIGAAYGAYIIHGMFIGLYGRAFESVPWPTVGVFFAAAPLILVSTWILAIAAKAVPGASRIL